MNDLIVSYNWSQFSRAKPENTEMVLALADGGSPGDVHVNRPSSERVTTAVDEDDCCHNGDLIQRGEAIYYVPYDFDLAGIVNASYAKPLPEMRLRSVRQRRYRGFCTDAETLRAAIGLVNARQEDILELIRSTPGLTAKDAEKAADYLSDFFEMAADEQKLHKAFERRCLED